LGMKVAAEAFRRAPLYKDYGEYPGNTSFEGVRISYAEDLAEFVTDQKYYYTNHTSTRPPAPGRLEHVAGYGSSPIVGYPGRGAYFLDWLAAGVWRLEVMPDAIWVRDPFEKPSPMKRVAVIAWNQWPMRIDLPDLAENFRAAGLNDGNHFSGQADGRTLMVRPGVYLLTRNGLTTKWDREDKWENLTLKEFVAPEPSVDRTYVLHEPAVEATAGKNVRVTATVVSPQVVEKVELVAYLPKAAVSRSPHVEPDQHVQPGGGNRPGPGGPDNGGAQTFEMTRVSGLEYSTEIPGDQVHAGTLRYHIAVRGPDGYTTFPSEIDAFPTDWVFYGKPWQTRIVPAGSPILLFDAAADTRMVTTQSRDFSYDLVPSDRPGLSALEVVARDLDRDEHDHSFRFFFRDKIGARNSELGSVSKIAMYGRSATNKPCQLQLALVTADAIAYGGLVTVQPEHGTYAIPLNALQKVRSPNIPHGYPVFIHYWSSTSAEIPLNVHRIESVLVSIGPGIPSNEYGSAHGVQIERIWLE
jgi:hypothetical protein